MDRLSGFSGIHAGARIARLAALMVSSSFASAFATEVPKKLPDRFVANRVIVAAELDNSVDIRIFPGHRPVDPVERTSWYEMGVDGYIAGPFFSGQGMNLTAKDTGEEKYALLMRAPPDYKVDSISLSDVSVSPGDADKVERTPRFWIYRDDAGLKLHVLLPGDELNVSTLSFRISITLARNDIFAHDAAIGPKPALPYAALLYARTVNGCNRLQLDYLPNVVVDRSAAARPDSACPTPIQKHAHHHQLAPPQ